MHTDTIADIRSFRCHESCSDFAIERAFARWVRQVEALVGHEIDDTPMELADALFADGLSPEEAAGEFAVAA